MRLFKLFIFLIILPFYFINGYPQEQPVKPVIRYVTIDTATNNTIINWTESPSPDVIHYVIYTELDPDNYIPLDTIPAPANQYIHVDPGFPPHKRLYAITAGNAAGIYSEIKPGIHGTIHLTTRYDSCNNQMRLSWNKYIGWEGSLSGYRIYGSVNNGNFTLLNGLTAEDSIYYQFGVNENTHYAYLVEAVKNDGLISLSDIARKYTYMPGPPETMVAEYARVTGRNLVELSFSVTDTSSVNKYALLRSGDKNADFISTFTISHAGSGNIVFMDTIITTRDIFYYKLGSLNSCNRITKESNLAVNILLKGEATSHLVELSWNQYEDFLQGVDEYILIIKTTDDITIERTRVPGTASSYTDDIRDLNWQFIEGEIIYQLIAVERNSGVTAFSNERIITSETDIFLPNAFTPNDDGINDVFQPVFNFIPEEYLLVIYDRQGIRVFSSGNPEIGWDGTVNGRKAGEGVYMYYIEYKSFSGRRKNLNGNVTLFYPW